MMIGLGIQPSIAGLGSESILVGFLTTVSTLQFMAYCKQIDNDAKELKKMQKIVEDSNVKLENSLRKQEFFILSFSHEFRNPLNIINGNLELVMQSVDDEETRERLIHSKICCDILLTQLNNVFDMAKIG